MITNYEIFDLLNRMDRANDFLKNKGDIEELLENLTLVQNYLARYESLGSLIKDFKKIEDLNICYQRVIYNRRCSEVHGRFCSSHI